ncbi:MAG: hypothetical protein ACXIVQ_10025 [Acidimicrobiales bacterium]
MTATVPTAPTSVEPALAAMTDRVGYLRWGLGEPSAEDVSCAELCGDPAALRSLILATGAGRDVDDEVVAASVFSLSYAYRVAGTTLAAGWLGGAHPDPSADNMWIGVSRNRPASVGYRRDHALDARAATERLFAEHLDPFRACLREAVRIGDRLVLGNLVAGVVSIARAVADASDDPTAAWAEVGRWLDDAPHDLGRFGRPIGPDFRRSTCCLWWKTTDSGGYCGDCSLTPDRHERRLADLEVRR